MSLTYEQAKKQLLQATPEERIAQLETARAELVIRKNEMERKIARFKESQKAKEVKEQVQAEQK